MKDIIHSSFKSDSDSGWIRSRSASEPKVKKEVKKEKKKNRKRKDKEGKKRN